MVMIPLGLIDSTYAGYDYQIVVGHDKEGKFVRLYEAGNCVWELRYTVGVKQFLIPQLESYAFAVIGKRLFWRRRLS